MAQVQQTQPTQAATNPAMQTAQTQKPLGSPSGQLVVEGEKKPIFKKWWFWLIVVLVLIGLGIGVWMLIK